jgi:hypothetical protein
MSKRHTAPGAARHAFAAGEQLLGEHDVRSAAHHQHRQVVGVGILDIARAGGDVQLGE